MKAPPVGFLYVVIAGAIGCLLLVQTAALPAWSHDVAVANPELAALRPALLAASILLVACAQAVLVATWRLVSMETWDTVFTPRAYPWVDVVIIALLAAVVLCGCTAIWLVGAGAGHPGVLLLLMGVAACAGAGGLLMRVMKAMLVRATENSAELERLV